MRNMKVLYCNEKVRLQCTELSAARKLFGGDRSLALSLLTRINALKEAEVLKDIILMPTFHFHKLQGKREGYFAIDVKTRRDKWRLILQPLDDEEKEFVPCHIDEIAGIVRVVEISEVSAHYE